MRVVLTEVNAHQKDPTGSLMSADADARQMMMNSAHIHAQTLRSLTGILNTASVNATRKNALIHSFQIGIKIHAAANATGR
jgi:major membrane immunogen (membrane-anchored lipoprotein)